MVATILKELFDSANSHEPRHAPACLVQKSWSVDSTVNWNADQSWHGHMPNKPS